MGADEKSIENENDSIQRLKKGDQQNYTAAEQKLDVGAVRKKTYNSILRAEKRDSKDESGYRTAKY